MFRNLMARLKATPPWVWITVALAAVGVVISFLIYRNGQSGNPSTAGVAPGDTSGGYSPYGNNGPATGGDSRNTNDLLQQIINLLNQTKAPPLQPPPVTPPPPAPRGNPGIGVPPHQPAPRILPGHQPGGPGGGPIKAPGMAAGMAPGSGIYQSSGRPGAGAGAPSVVGSVHHSDHLTDSLPHPGALAFGVAHPGMLN